LEVWPKRKKIPFEAIFHLAKFGKKLGIKKVMFGIFEVEHLNYIGKSIEQVTRPSPLP
jgi:hypothetical protein